VVPKLKLTSFFRAIFVGLDAVVVENGSVSHTCTATYFHCIFSTKERKDLIPDNLRPKLWAYMEGTAKNIGMIPIAIGGTANHAHLLLGLKTNMTIAEAVHKLKANSSRWVGEHGLSFE
jgi:putative transposase